MLKRLLVNRRTVPVPVPIKTVAQALSWVEQTLVTGDQVITKVMLNGDEITDDSRDVVFTGNARFEVFIESPIDLSVQTLETARNLAGILCGTLKPLAVACWEAPAKQPPLDLEGVLVDVKLVIDLIDHFHSLIASAGAYGPELASLGQSIHQSLKSLQMARAQSDWRGFAKILLNRLEGELDKLCSESASVQASILSHKSMRRAETGDLQLR